MSFHSGKCTCAKYNYAQFQASCWKRPAIWEKAFSTASTFYRLPSCWARDRSRQALHAVAPSRAVYNWTVKMPRIYAHLGDAYTCSWPSWFIPEFHDMLSDVTYDRGSLKMHCVIFGPIEKPASSISARFNRPEKDMKINILKWSWKVKKTQTACPGKNLTPKTETHICHTPRIFLCRQNIYTFIPVSYTHLTLPTILRV